MPYALLCVFLSRHPGPVLGLCCAASFWGSGFLSGSRNRIHGAGPSSFTLLVCDEPPTRDGADFFFPHSVAPAALDVCLLTDRDQRSGLLLLFDTGCRFVWSTPPSHGRGRHGGRDPDVRRTLALAPKPFPFRLLRTGLTDLGQFRLGPDAKRLVHLPTVWTTAVTSSGEAVARSGEIDPSRKRELHAGSRQFRDSRETAILGTRGTMERRRGHDNTV